MKQKFYAISNFFSNIFLYTLLFILLIIGILFSVSFVDHMIGVSKQETRFPLFAAYIIVSQSMIPNIEINDAIVTFRADPARINTYDIITFLSKEIDTKGTPITHRVVGIVNLENGEKAYRTKGDNNDVVDNALIREDEVIGKVLFKIPKLGYIRSFLIASPGKYIIFFVIFFLFVYDGFRFASYLYKKRRKGFVIEEEIEVLEE